MNIYYCNALRAAAAFSSESERENVVYRTTRGMRDRVAAGNLTGRGRAAYGYHYADRGEFTNAVYVIYEPESKVVVWIFERAAEGWSMRQIAKTLTEQGVPTQRMGHGK
jgi:Recombinase